MITAFLGIWVVTIISKGNLITRLDTIVLIIAVMSLLPLFITKNRSAILLYLFANLFILITFILTKKSELGMNNNMAIEFIVDNTIAIVFTGIIGYYIYTIYNNSIEQVAKDNRTLIKAEQELATAELRYRTIIETSRDGILLTDLNGQITFGNKRIAEMIKVDDAESLIGNNLTNYLVEKDQKFIKSTLIQLNHLGHLENIFVNALNSDGTVFPAEMNLIILKNNEGISDSIMANLRDISKRIKAEEELKETEDRYQTLMDNLNDIIMMVDNDDHVLYVNKKFTEKLGYSKDEIVGKVGYEILVDNEGRDFIKKANQDRMSKKTGIYEFQFIAKNGTKIDFLVSGAPVLDAEGKTIGSIGAMVDITDRKKAEKALKESEEKYRTLMESMNEVIMMVDNEDRVQYVNKQFTESLGYLPEEIIGEIGFKFLFDQSELEIINNASKNRGQNQVSQYELSFAAKDGHKITFLVSAAPIASSDLESPGFILAMVDITEKKIIEKELEKYRNHLELLVQERTDELAAANEELVSTNEELLRQREELEAVLLNLQNTQKQLIQSEKMASLGILAAGVAHEINNPLNFIKGGVVGLENYFAETLHDNTDEIAPLLEGINVGVERAAAIVSSLNHYSRKGDSPLISCNMHFVIDNCLVILQNQIKYKIEIIKKYTPKSFELICDDGKLHQAILNILTNAIQAIEQKGSIIIETDINDKIMKIVFTDNGCGISDENLPRILDPFFTTKDPGQGKGLGLAIAYNILHEHNGTIDIKSKLNKGTIVTIKLPLKLSK